MIRHVALVGPTAAGKSDLALGLARSDPRFEIVSLDSMQVYRGMDIGTAKPTPAERAEVAHHLVDVVDPRDEWSVARTQSDARAALADIEGRGGRALLVGGTGLYVHAVIDAFTLPGEDRAVRADLEAQTAEPDGLDAAWRALYTADPVAAARIDPGNRRRIVRALEVIAVTGRPFSSFGPGVLASAGTRLPSTGAGSVSSISSRVRMLGLWQTREQSAEAIERRIGAMRAGGLVEEVESLRARPWARSARQAIGYKEIDAALASGASARGLDTAFELVGRRTRRFARRQRMWFRRDQRVTWIHASNPDDRAQIAQEIVAEPS